MADRARGKIGRLRTTPPVCPEVAERCYLEASQMF